jgi:hypothetical protein
VDGKAHEATVLGWSPRPLALLALQLELLPEKPSPTGFAALPRSLALDDAQKVLTVTGEAVAAACPFFSPVGEPPMCPHRREGRPWRAPSAAVGWRFAPPRPPARRYVPLTRRSALSRPLRAPRALQAAWLTRAKTFVRARAPATLEPLVR